MKVGNAELIGINDSQPVSTALVGVYETDSVPRKPVEVFQAELGAFLRGNIVRLDAEPQVPRLDTQHDMATLALEHTPEVLPIAV